MGFGSRSTWQRRSVSFYRSARAPTSVTSVQGIVTCRRERADQRQCGHLLHDALRIAGCGIVTPAVDSRSDHPDGVDVAGTTDQHQLITRLKLRAAGRYDKIPLSLDSRDDDAYGQPGVVEG